MACGSLPSPEVPLLPAPAHTACVLRELAIAPDPLSAFERLRTREGGWILDSALRGGPQAAYSFVGAGPYAIARARGRELELTIHREADPRFACGVHRERGDVLTLLRALLPRRPSAAPPRIPFAGGAVGYLGYELAEQVDVHDLHARDDLHLPDAAWLFVDRLVAFEHATGRVVGLGLGMSDDAREARSRAEEAAEALVRELASDPSEHIPNPHPQRESEPARTGEIDVAAYAKAVDAIQQEIAAGNVYQACLTARAIHAWSGDPWRLYRALRRKNPAPFACFVELPEVAILSSSPERFLRVTREGEVESRPIKGTAARRGDPALDAAQLEQLARSEKDRAENLMIVDLVRNDLGRVCETGSVHVSELMAIEAYASVFQMVSTVRGRLAPARDAFDAVAATFPPGSMTGAPKIAAMEILDRLEPVRRGIYSGAIGYLDAWGGADLSVVIRTLLVQPGRAVLHAGGGIVADSDPTAEVREALLKLHPLLAALEQAGGPGAGPEEP